MRLNYNKKIFDFENVTHNIDLTPGQLIIFPTTPQETDLKHKASLDLFTGHSMNQPYIHYSIGESDLPAFATSLEIKSCISMKGTNLKPKKRYPDFSLLEESFTKIRVFIMKNEEIIFVDDEEEKILYLLVGKRFKTSYIKEVLSIILKFSPEEIIVPRPQFDNQSKPWVRPYMKKCAKIEKFLNSTVTVPKSQVPFRYTPIPEHKKYGKRK